jgi:adenylylsulfate kinase-like enzyme
MRRDPKGLYRQALADPLNQMPGIGTAYEPSQCPDVIVHTEYEFPDAAAARIIETLVKRGFLKERETPEANPAPATANADGGG